MSKARHKGKHKSSRKDNAASSVKSVRGTGVPKHKIGAFTARARALPLWVKLVAPLSIGAVALGAGVTLNSAVGYTGSRNASGSLPFMSASTGITSPVSRITRTESSPVRSASRSEVRTEVEPDVSWGGIETLNIPVTMTAHDKKTLETLKGKLKEAKDLVKSSAGKVDKDDNRNALRNAIGKAEASLKGISGFDTHIQALDSAMGKVRDDVKTRADREAALRAVNDDTGLSLSAQAQEQARNAGNAPVNSDGVLQHTSQGTPTVNPPDGRTGQDVADYAMQFLGYPYVWGAAGPDSFDCSGLVMYVYAQFGVSLPHYSGSQMGYGKPVNSLAEAKPGDILVNASHAAIYLGDGKIINALNPSEGVRVTGVNVFTSGYAIRRLVD